MNYKQQVKKGIAVGSIVIVISTVLVYLLEQYFPESLRRFSLEWLYVYALPLIVLIGLVVIKRYNDQESINAAYGGNNKLSLEKAILQNTQEQTIIAVLLIVSFSHVAPVYLEFIGPLHAILFMIGRIMFVVGYHKSSLARIPGFVVNQYSNLILLLLCVVYSIAGI